MKPLLLPRGAFHYSCYKSWNESPERYKNRFFEGGRDFLNKSMEFGEHVMYLLEHDPSHPTVADLPSFGNTEYPLTTMIEDVPILTHPDDIDEDGSWGVLEYKTALWRGKPNWTVNKVYSWIQIPFYSMCVREKNGWYNAYDNFIVEIPTRRIDTVEEDGIEWNVVTDEKRKEISRAIQEDGTFMPAIMHRRIVPQVEIDTLREKVIRTAREISSEYVKYLRTETL